MTIDPQNQTSRLRSRYIVPEAATISPPFTLPIIIIIFFFFASLRCLIRLILKKNQTPTSTIFKPGIRKMYERTVPWE